MIYTLDKELTYKPLIYEQLEAYNENIIGRLPTDQFNVYVFDDYRLVGAAITEMGWNWVYCKDLFFDDKRIAFLLFDAVNEYYRDTAIGIKYSTDSESLKTILLDCGFVVAGELSNTPQHVHRYVLTSNLQTTFDIVPEEQILTSEVPLKVYQNQVDKHQLDFFRAHNTIPKHDEIVIAVTDDNVFVGGVYGFFISGLLYIQLLSLDESYRKQGIGSKLIKQMEQYAMSNNIYHAFVSTTSFQAKDFYLKQGYIHDITINNKPKGYCEYTFSKSLRKDNSI